MGELIVAEVLGGLRVRWSVDLIQVCWKRSREAVQRILANKTLEDTLEIQALEDVTTYHVKLT